MKKKDSIEMDSHEVLHSTKMYSYCILLYTKVKIVYKKIYKIFEICKKKF